MAEVAVACAPVEHVCAARDVARPELLQQRVLLRARQTSERQQRAFVADGPLGEGSKDVVFGCQG